MTHGDSDIDLAVEKKVRSAPRVTRCDMNWMNAAMLPAPETTGDGNQSDAEHQKAGRFRYCRVAAAAILLNLAESNLLDASASGTVPVIRIPADEAVGLSQAG